MKIKRFAFLSLIAVIVYFLLGFVFYGIVFKNVYPTGPEEKMSFIFLGCLFYGTLLSYVIGKKLHLKNWKRGLKVGAIVSGLVTASTEFFSYSSMNPDYNKIFISILLGVVMGGIVGLIVALINKIL